MNFLRAIIAFFNSSPNVRSTGALKDPRPKEKKDLDWLHEERIMAKASDPFRFDKITESPYPYLNQKGTQSCVPHAVAMAERIERKNDTGVYVSPSPIFAYRQRSNYPDEGSWPPEIFQIIKDSGLPIYESLPTPNMELQANGVVITEALRNEAAIYKGKSYFTFGVPNDIDNIAQIAAQGHAVPICLYATYKEYAQLYPQILTQDLQLAKAEVAHEVFVLPYGGFAENGMRYVAIQDSAWFGGFKIRYLSEEFIKKRVYHAGYWDTVSTIGGGPRPKYRFMRNLVVGSKGEEVRQVQLLLIAENLLPGDCATGVFGGLTLAGVRAFQVKYADKVLDPLGLASPTNTWGPACIKQANALVEGL